VGATFQSLLAQPHAVLAQILLVNTLANVAATATAAVLLDRAFDRFALPEWSTVLASTVGLTAVLLIVTELMPKTWAFEKSESAAPALARAFRLLQPALAPAARGLERLAAWVARFGAGVGRPSRSPQTSWRRSSRWARARARSTPRRPGSFAVRSALARRPPARSSCRAPTW